MNSNSVPVRKVTDPGGVTSGLTIECIIKRALLLVALSGLTFKTPDFLNAHKAKRNSESFTAGFR